MRPNTIPGMKTHGIGRASKNAHFKKLYRKWRIEDAQRKKQLREDEHRSKNGHIQIG